MINSLALHYLGGFYESFSLMQEKLEMRYPVLRKENPHGGYMAFPRQFILGFGYMGVFWGVLIERWRYVW